MNTHRLNICALILTTAVGCEHEQPDNQSTTLAQHRPDSPMAVIQDQGANPSGWDAPSDVDQPDLELEEIEEEEPEEMDAPPEMTTTESSQEAVSLYLGHGLNLDMMLVPGGTFMMGSPADEVGRYIDEEQHEVTLRNDYYVMTTEVTQGMFNAMMGYDSRVGETDIYGTGTDYPAYHSSWSMSAAFANAVTLRHNAENGTDFDLCYSCEGNGDNVVCEPTMNPYECDGYRLLTEAEWERAARAESTAAVWTPDGGADLVEGTENSCDPVELSDGSSLSDIGWFCGSSTTGSQEVGMLIPNDYGLYDMIGNVWEWTHDAYVEFDGESAVDPVTTEGRYRVFRGGYWSLHPFL